MSSMVQNTEASPWWLHLDWQRSRRLSDNFNFQLNAICGSTSPWARPHTHTHNTHSLIGNWLTAQHVISADLEASGGMCDKSFKFVSVSSLFPAYSYLPTVECPRELWEGQFVVRNAWDWKHANAHGRHLFCACSVKQDPQLDASRWATGKENPSESSYQLEVIPVKQMIPHRWDWKK